MKSSGLLQFLYSFFLGLVVAGFVGIGVTTFYPYPDTPWRELPPGQLSPGQLWSINTGIILLVCATVIMVVSLIRPDRQAVLSNGLLLGGLFTMVVGVSISLGSGQSWTRFAIIAVALAITVGVGWLKFVRVGRGTPAAPAASPEGGALEERVAALEARLDAVARALRP